MNDMVGGVRPLWIVSSGEYSDYGVICAFATKELAQAYADRMNRAGWEREREQRRGESWWVAPSFEEYVRRSADAVRLEVIQFWDRLPIADEVRETNLDALANPAD